MPQIKIKRVYDDPEKSDGYRILVDRLWPRGIKKECLQYDEWAKEITPSPRLRSWFHNDISGHWEEFTSMYREELSHSESCENISLQNKILPYSKLYYTPLKNNTQPCLHLTGIFGKKTILKEKLSQQFQVISFRI